MGKLTWITFGILFVSCSAQFGFNRNERIQQRPQLFPINNRPQKTPFRRTTDRLLQTFGINPDDHKCFTLARRPFYISRMVQYPCSRSMPGLPVIRSFMGKCKHHRRPIGPICMSYIREPVYKYYKIPMCCPGYAMDITGKCSIKTNKPVQPPMPSMPSMAMMRQRPMGRNGPDPMMSMASQMQQAMWLKAKKDMSRRRAMLLVSMSAANKRRRNNINNRNTPRRKTSSIVPMYFMYKMHQDMMKRRQEQKPRVTFLKFHRPSSPPMPHPVSQPPLSGRVVNLIKGNMGPMGPRPPMAPFPMMMMRTPSLPPPPPPMFNMMKSQAPMVPRVVLSSRSSMAPFSKLREFHPREPMPSPVQIAERPSFPDVMPQEEQFPMIPGPQQSDPMDQAVDGFQGGLDQEFEQFTVNDGFQSSHNHDGHVHGDHMMQVDLPSKPVEMPDLIVEQTPLGSVNQDSCIVKLEAAVKSCLVKNNIDVPDVMSAFEPFNDDKSRVLCDAEDAIFKCISAALNECDQTNDAEVARDMLLETAQTVRSMCELRSASVQTEHVPDATRTSPAQENLSADTMATVENVDAIPTDVKVPATPEKEITIIEDQPAAASSVETVKEAIQHEVHVQEIRMKEYLLPILLGAGVGFIVLVLFLSLLICCCCKRRLRKKMRMAKETEKPPINGIYTIGVTHPTYEVKGIPAMYYEEAKGEKISSRSSPVTEGGDAVPKEADEE